MPVFKKAREHARSRFTSFWIYVSAVQGPPNRNSRCPSVPRAGESRSRCGVGRGRALAMTRQAPPSMPSSGPPDHLDKSVPRWMAAANTSAQVLTPDGVNVKVAIQQIDQGLLSIDLSGVVRYASVVLECVARPILKTTKLRRIGGCRVKSSC